MSEPISAFAVYRANGVQKSGGKKNNKTRSPGKPSPKARTANGGAAAKRNNKMNGGTSASSKNGKSNSTMSYNNNNNVKKTSDPLAADMALLSKPASQLSKAERKKQNELRKFYGLNANNQVCSQSDASMGDSALEYTVNSHAGSSSDEEDDDYDVECGEEEGETDSGEEEGEEDSEDDDDDDIIEDVQDMEEVEVNSSDNDTDAPEEYVNDEDAEEFNLAAIRAAKKSTGANKRRSTEAGTAEEVTQTKQPRASLTANRRPSAAVSPKPKTPEPVVAKRVVSNVKLEPFSPTGNAAKSDSLAEGEKLFRWLLNPLQLDEFYAKFWEQGVCLIKREQRNYYSHLISFELIGQMLLQNHVEFTKNLDITRYRNGKRETLNPEGRALPPAVWDQYRQGCSVRLLNPQTFIPTLHTLCATMQEYFHCLVGVNAYLTPAGTQGFAPHYDDIEAFVLQIEGKKRWRLYKPRKPEEHLPRFSSENFKQSEIGQPIFDDVLKPGDLLYFPRGTIHQACSEPDVHSLHLTLSVYQKQSYADLFERMMPLILEKAFASHLEIRRGLPLHLWRHAGIAFSDNDTKERADLQTHLKKLVTKCLTAVPMEQIIDQAVDQMAKKYQHEALPPVLSAEERSRTIFGSVSRTNDAGQWVCDFDITIRSNVRLLRANILRLIEEEGQMRIYYYLDNSKEYCEYEPNFIEIERKEAASVEVLIRSYPQYVSVSQLPLKSDERKIGVVSALWERGLLMLEKPF